jgi:hypothetical protein
LIASDRVEGTPVRRSDGGKIGTIERLMIDEMRSAAGQLGAASIKALQSLEIRHVGAIDFGRGQGR